MAEKKFSGAPFGSQSARFDVSALHPVYKKPGTYTQVSYCRSATSEQDGNCQCAEATSCLGAAVVTGTAKVITLNGACADQCDQSKKSHQEGRRLGPGTYDPAPGDFTASVLERKASAPGWKRAEEIEKLTQMPHLLYRETWERNRLLKQNMGPGRYNIKTFTDLMEEKPSSVRGACSTREVRFKENMKECFPGPGSYGKGGNPYSMIEERATKSASSKGIMDSTASSCDSAATMGSELGPGTYNLKNSTDETLKHVVGKRGPYDLFTGSRSQPILYGYFATPPVYCAEKTLPAT